MNIKAGACRMRSDVPDTMKANANRTEFVCTFRCSAVSQKLPEASSTLQWMVHPKTAAANKDDKFMLAKVSI